MNYRSLLFIIFGTVKKAVIEICLASSPGLPLCRLDAKMSEIRSLGPACYEDLPRLARCAVGGRDHLPCCQRRGVPNR